MRTPIFTNMIGAGFILLTLVSYGWLLYKLHLSRKALRNTIIGLAMWMIFLGAWSLSGMAMRFDLFPVNLAPVLMIPLVTIIIITIKAPKVSLKTLTHLQVFRVFVEILLWALFVENLMPIQMTFEGRNWDILSGLTAPLAGLFLIRSKWGLAIWNLVCLGLLINVVSVAILSLPGPLRMFFNEPSNAIVATFPFILLPGMLVPLAYGLSLLSLRQIFSLTSQNEEISPAPSHRNSV